MNLFRRAALAALLAGGLLACQGNPALEEPKVVAANYQPASNSDEAGLWQVMDRSEQELKTSGSLIRDEKAAGYLRGIICKLAPDICKDVRVYLVRSPHFNASMAPNGVMQVWSGLLLRTENEAQLAYILGHEIAHYRYRHSLQQFRKTKNTAALVSVFKLAAAAGGVGYVNPFADVAAYGSLMKFSRDHEREADQTGIKMLLAAGYDPRQASLVWGYLMEEQKAMDEKGPGVFFSTHPGSLERVKTLEGMAAEASPPAGGWQTGRDSFDAVVGPLRSELMRDELRLRRFAATEKLLERLRKGGAPEAETQFFLAELYNARGEKDDRKKAENAYLACLKHPAAPPEAHRELGLIHMKTARPDQAVEHLTAYLQKRPDAFDGGMVKAYIQRIQTRETTQ